MAITTADEFFVGLCYTLMQYGNMQCLAKCNGSIMSHFRNIKIKVSIYKKLQTPVSGFWGTASSRHSFCCFCRCAHKIKVTIRPLLSYYHRLLKLKVYGYYAARPVSSWAVHSYLLFVISLFIVTEIFTSM